MVSIVFSEQFSEKMKCKMLAMHVLAAGHIDAQCIVHRVSCHNMMPT